MNPYTFAAINLKKDADEAQKKQHTINVVSDENKPFHSMLEAQLLRTYFSSAVDLIHHQKQNVDGFFVCNQEYLVSPKSNGTFQIKTVVVVKEDQVLETIKEHRLLEYIECKMNRHSIRNEVISIEQLDANIIIRCKKIPIPSLQEENIQYFEEVIDGMVDAVEFLKECTYAIKSNGRISVVRQMGRGLQNGWNKIWDEVSKMKSPACRICNEDLQLINQ